MKVHSGWLIMTLLIDLHKCTHIVMICRRCVWLFEAVYESIGDRWTHILFHYLT